MPQARRRKLLLIEASILLLRWKMLKRLLSVELSQMLDMLREESDPRVKKWRRWFAETHR